MAQPKAGSRTGERRPRVTRHASLDEMDARLIERLRIDGRASNTHLARELGVTESTVRKRLDRLLRDQVIRIGVLADPLKVGYQTYAIMAIHVSPPRLAEVAEALAKLPEITFVGICTGGFDISAVALIRSNEHMYKLIADQLSQIPGIERTSTAHVIRLVKREFSHPITTGDPTQPEPEADLPRAAGRGAPKSGPRGADPRPSRRGAS